MNRPDPPAIMQAVTTAYDYARKHIDLTGCSYGPQHTPQGVPGPYRTVPCDYYYFLSGLAAQLKCARILELGGHFGGATCAMARGAGHAGMEPEAEIVMVELEETCIEMFKGSKIQQIVGDCTTAPVIEQVVQAFTGPVDLMYVDLHNAGAYLELYFDKLRPNVVVLDDIHFTPWLREAWADLLVKYPDRAIDITGVSHREPTDKPYDNHPLSQSVGFGLLMRPHPLMKE